MAYKKYEEAEEDPKRAGRAERFASVLKKQQIPTHGAQKIVSEKIDVSDATVAAWMRGSLPRNPEVLIRFCDAYSVDLYWWVNGEARPQHKVVPQKYLDAIKYVDDYFVSHSIEITERQRHMIAAEVYNDPAVADKYLETLAPVLQCA